MRTIPVSASSRTLNELLQKARRRSVILETANGQRFVLASLNAWEGFDVGNSKDFGKEAARTIANDKLMKALVSRQKSAKRTSLSDVKEQLGIK